MNHEFGGGIIVGVLVACLVIGAADLCFDETHAEDEPAIMSDGTILLDEDLVVGGGDIEFENPYPEPWCKDLRCEKVHRLDTACEPQYILYLPSWQKDRI